MPYTISYEDWLNEKEENLYCEYMESGCQYEPDSIYEDWLNEKEENLYCEYMESVVNMNLTPYTKID